MVYRHIALVDKPKGITSHTAVQIVKKTLGADRAGHSGTLDSSATGLLVVALDEARKAMPALMGLPKEYMGIIHLHGDVPVKKVRETAKQFLGKVIQVPPRKSRVVRQPREREVFSFNIMALKDRKLEFRMSCQAGFYVRKFAHDFGTRLGCGAHLAELRRVRVGPFDIKDSLVPERVKKKDLIRLEAALDKIKLKRVVVKDFAVRMIRSGSPVRPGQMLRKVRAEFGERVGIFDRRGSIIALGIAEEGRIRTDRVFNA